MKIYDKREHEGKHFRNIGLETLQALMDFCSHGVRPPERSEG